MTDQAKEALRAGLQRWLDDRFGPSTLKVRLGPREPEPEPGPNEYRCSMCRGVYSYAPDWSEHDARNEAEENFPGLMDAPDVFRAEVCDVCYQLMMKPIPPSPLWTMGENAFAEGRDWFKGDDQC